MKREALDNEAPYFKRARHEGNDGFSNMHPDRQHGQMRRQDRPNQPRYNGPGERRPNEHHQKHRHPTPKPAPVLQDPVLSLENLLRSLTAQPDVVKSVLGTSVLESASQLLTSLSSRAVPHKAWLDIFQPTSIEHPTIHTHAQAPTESNTPVTKTSSLPPLPSVPEGPYLQATFTHKSTTQHDRVSGAGDLTYEKLEFLGDAYIEIIATRLIFDRYPNLPAGRQAQTRERLVKNETLAHFSAEYGFRERIQASDMEHAKNGGVKILADVFEAYVAAVILSDPLDGFRRVEEWLTELWAPILMQDSAAPLGNRQQQHSQQQEYNPNAKQELQKKILGNDTRLEYREDRPMEQSKHAQKYFIGLYLTGYGYQARKIGHGEGRNKVEAGNRAAMMAFRDHVDIVDDAAEQLRALKEHKKLEREEREKTQADGSETVVVIGEA